MRVKKTEWLKGNAEEYFVQQRGDKLQLHRGNLTVITGKEGRNRRIAKTKITSFNGLSMSNETC
jgi:hypothetical protein